ncbi:MAG: hypothetical protein GWN16_00665 [Calditrichae bacterium]|nr:hypothetical protein [Calditrichia bacterium]
MKSIIFKHPIRNVILLIILGSLFNCGGGSPPLTENPKPIGLVPFSTDNLSGDGRQLNQALIHSLNKSGSFRVILLQNQGQLVDLAQFEEQFYTWGERDSTGFSRINPGSSGEEAIAASADSGSAIVQNSDLAYQSISSATPRWILTGKFLREIEFVDRGQWIPYLLYSPSTGIIAELEYRLYDAEKKRWAAIRVVDEKVDKNGDKQLLSYNESDPSLAIFAKERQQMHAEVYDKLFGKMIESLEELMEIKR